AIELREGKRFERRNDLAHARCVERNEVRIAVHEADMPPVRTDLRLISREQGSLSVFRVSRMQDLEAREVPAHTNQGQPIAERVSVSPPKCNAGITPLHPLPITLVQVNRNALERVAPL